jgi:hypothetical protein
MLDEVSCEGDSTTQNFALVPFAPAPISQPCPGEVYHRIEVLWYLL